MNITLKLEATVKLAAKTNTNDLWFSYVLCDTCTHSHDTFQHALNDSSLKRVPRTDSRLDV